MATLLKYLLSAACIVYVLWGLDAGQLLDVLHRMSVADVLAAQAILMLTLVPAALRLRYVAPGAPLKTATRAFLIGSAFNAAFPAKLGELAKVMVLHRESPMPMGMATGAVFWERFADLNCLLVLGIAAAAALHMSLALLPLAAIVGGLWLGLGLLKLKPHWFTAVIDRLPWESLRSFLRNTMLSLSGGKERAFLLKLSLLSVANWGIFVAFVFYLLEVAIPSGLSGGQVMAVVVASILGVAIPAAPAGVGVFESLVVGALVLAGTPKEQALATALILHVLQTLLPALLGFALMARSPYRAATLRRETEAA